MTERALFLPDVNILLALSISGHPHHNPARTWLDSVEAPGAVLVARAVQVSFLRLLTTAAVFAAYDEEPLTNTEAWAVNDALFADFRVSHLAVEPPGIGSRFRAYSELRSASPERWMDAYLAALAVASGAALVSTDAALASYSQLETVVVRS